MKCRSEIIDDKSQALPKLPIWVASKRAETFEIVAFRSGAVLTVLDGLVCDPSYGVPVELLVNRLALTAATATSKLEGRSTREEDIRDAFHLTPPGESCGPDGDLLGFWRHAVHQQLKLQSGQADLTKLVAPNLEAEVGSWMVGALEQTQVHGPLSGCSYVIRKVLAADDRAERIACLLSDVVLARALNWTTVLPVSAQRLSKTMLRELVAGEPGADLAVLQRLLNSIEITIRLACDLAQRSAALRKIAPKLRAKGSGAAVKLFLSEDAVAPSTMLSPFIKGTSIPMTDRAARRFCDRLVGLGVARELTGRSTFRLYGVGP